MKRSLLKSVGGAGIPNHNILVNGVGKEYAKADSRWGMADPTIVSLEIVTVLFNGCLCVLLIYSILSKSPHRYLPR